MESKKYVIAMDQGTTSSRAILFNKRGEIQSSQQREFRQIFPKPGWVEHDPMEIWSTQMGVAMEAMQKIDARPEDIAAIGITNQRETTVIWDAATGRPVYNAIVWQCRRTSDIIDRLKSDGLSGYIQEKTGLIPDADFSASKIAWILRNVPGVKERARRGELRFGTVDSWLIWNLTDGRVHATDYTNASRTMLFDIHKLCWDEEILDYFGIPASLLPEVRPSSSYFGETERFGGAIPICGAAGDQQAALFGQCGFNPGEVKCTYGTGGFMLMNTGRDPIHSQKGLLTTIAAGEEDRVSYALEGSAFIAGAAIQWLRDEMRMIRTSPQSQTYCEAVPDSGGVYIVPAFSGMGAPYWDQYAHGLICGITRGTTAAHIARAALDGIAFQTMDIVAAMERDAGVKLSELKVDGGASRNNLMMQFQADILGASVIRPQVTETTALGACYLAGLAVGFWGSLDEVKRQWQAERIFLPSDADTAPAKAGWADAIQRTLTK